MDECELISQACVLLGEMASNGIGGWGRGPGGLPSPGDQFGGGRGWICDASNLILESGSNSGIWGGDKALQLVHHSLGRLMGYGMDQAILGQLLQ